jgi:DNA-binding transcriptional LysR family regulator
LAHFDLQLLYVFDEIYKTSSVTRAADNLGLPQSTVSIALGKLRKHFGDRLFSRTAKGMEPTPHAQEVIGDVRRAIEALGNALTHRDEFDPASATREFRVGMTDISEIVLLPRLLNHLTTAGPGIRFDISKISESTPRDLEDGAVDLALGFMPHLEAGFYQQSLFQQNFVCLVAQGHPRVQGVLSKDDFSAEGHLSVKTSGTGHYIVDRALEKHGTARRIVLQLPSFLGLGRIVAETPFIATVPEKYASAVRAGEALQVLPCPFPMPSFAVKQHWHERYHADPANSWLRRTLSALFTE